MTTRPSILFYCQHSMQMGQLVRSLALAQGLADRFRVMVLNGGRLPKGLEVPANVELVNLPPLGTDESNQIVSHDKRIPVERALDLRQKMIGVCFDNLHPVAILVETFPFGLKKFTRELLPLLQAARAPETRALIVCSVRDILAGRRDKQQKHDDRVAALANKFFDLVLVHSDPSFARLEESFRPSTPLEVPVKHTGFVVTSAAPAQAAISKRKRIVVSAGGGLVGESLLRLAIQTYKCFEANPQFEMRIVGGPFLPDNVWHELKTIARGRDRLKVVRHVPDLCSELSSAAVSISQAGYNTCVDVLRAGVPALLVPFGDEQHKRALRLQRLGAVKVLGPDEQTPPRLAAEIRELVTAKLTTPIFDFDGVHNSVQAIEHNL